MPSSVTFNGNTYTIPVTGDLPSTSWGADTSTYLAALAVGAAGLNVANSFTAQQLFQLGVGLVPRSEPTQTANVQLYAGVDGNLYAMPGTGSPAVAAQLTPVGNAPARYVVKTANYTVLSDDSGKHFLNTGAAGTITFTLPASPTLGLEYEFTCSAAKALVVAGGTFVGPGSLTGTALTVYGATAANRYTTFKLAYDGVEWLIENVFGSLSVA